MSAIAHALAPFGGAATVAALSVAAVFALAAVTKIVTPATTVTDFAALGLPAAGSLARLVPVVEAAIAVTLVARPRAGAALAIVALAGFTVVLVAAVTSGRDVSCGCLGPLGRRPVGWGSVARNGALAVLALVAAATPAPVVPDLPSVIAVSTLAVLLATVVGVVGLWSEIGRIWSVALAGEPVPARRSSRPATPSKGSRS